MPKKQNQREGQRGRDGDYERRILHRAEKAERWSWHTVLCGAESVLDGRRKRWRSVVDGKVVDELMLGGIQPHAVQQRESEPGDRIGKFSLCSGAAWSCIF